MCRRIFALSSGTPPFSNLSFCPSWPVCHLREHLYMCSTNPSHTLTCVCHLLIYSSTSHFPHVLHSSLFATMVCVPPSPPLCLKCGASALRLARSAMVTPQLWSSSRAGANKEATDEVRKRIKYTLTCDSQNGLKEEALSGLSLPRCR